MVIRDANFRWPLFGPFENNAPLLVDTNGVVAEPISAQHFKAISRRHPEIIQFPCLIELNQFSQGHPRDLVKPFVLFVVEKRFRILVTERLNHENEGVEA